MNKVRDYLIKDIKEFNVKLLIISGILFLFVMGLISYKITINESYALFEDTVTGTKTITFHYEDLEQTKPKITLTKETYIEGFDNWTFTNAYVDSDGVLVLGENLEYARATSDYYETNSAVWKATFDAYTTTACNNSTRGGILAGMYYYDINKRAATTVLGYTNNGIAFSANLNEWTTAYDNRFNYDDGYVGENTKYTKIEFSAGGSGGKYSNPIVKIRNFKFYGQMPNNFYLINIKTTTTDNVGVKEIKYTKGEEDLDFFKTDGIVSNSDQIRVTENGIYTIYVKDNKYRKSISTIEIDKIINNEGQG